MDEQKSRDAAALLNLIEQVLQGTATDEQKQELQDHLLANPEDRKVYLHHLNLHSALRRQFAFDGEVETPGQLALANEGPTAHVTRRGTVIPKIAKWSWATGAVVAVVWIASLFFQRPNVERPIATITGISGALQWTGDGGRVLDRLSVGTELPGGTVEGMTPNSWFEFEFIDGSTVTISGNSMLTFSDHGQKRLHLKEGTIAANVNPQPAHKPMLIYTRSAMLEVVGTQFEVETGLAATMLNVSTGEVRVTRMSDKKTVNVLARHRVIAAAGRELAPEPVPDSVSQWKSQLHFGPEATQGKWLPETDTEDARLGALPYTTPRGITIYTVGFTVSRGDRPPVILQPGSRLRVRGRIKSTHRIYFGMTVRQPNGEFAGRFQTTRLADEFRAGRDFELALHLDDSQLDPTLAEMKHKLPSNPLGLVVDTFWCHTLDKPAGLEIAEVELLSPTDSAAHQTSTAQPPQPVMDIWTAASQGNLKAVKHRLAAGVDIDATVTAPGFPASGATPLHLAILADQRQVAEYLITNGANLGIKAQDEHGGTPLHWAAALGRIEMTRRLLEARADINATDNNGFTPLDATNYAPEYETEAKAQIAELLRTKGAHTRDERQQKP